MFDLEIHLEHRPGAIAAMGIALGNAGISVEGGGSWVVGEMGYAHFLVEDGEGAIEALKRANIKVVACRPVVLLRLRQDLPGQLGLLTAKMAASDVNIQVLYSDHDHRLVLVTDNYPAAQRVANDWVLPIARVVAKLPDT